MDSGLLLALAFGAVVIVLAIILTRLTRAKRRGTDDRNASQPDARSAATWEGIRQARDMSDDERP